MKRENSITDRSNRWNLPHPTSADREKKVGVLREYVQYFTGNRRLLLVPLCICTLSLFGLLTLSSASLSFVHSNYLLRQCLWFAFALPAAAIGLLIPLQWLRKRSRKIAIVAAALLVLVLIPGIGLSVNGSRRWIPLGPIHFQVSEFAKVAFVLLLADYLSRHQENIGNWKEGFLRPTLIVAFFTAMLLLEPDYGTALLFLSVGMALLFLSGTSLRLLFACIICAIFLFALFIALNPVRLGRVLSFWNIESTKLTGSYQLWQGLIGFNSGGLFGLGLGNGRQQRFYLPEAHTDFIFPVLAEELGYLFALFIIALYVVTFALAWFEIYRIHSPFFFLFANGIMLFICVQTLINLSVVMGIFPTKGMALPLISYGGSNLVFVFALFGLLLNCMRSAYFEKPNVENCL
ncbi:MAG: putative lipid II flippase FtsW [Puniceicoccales bacterium]|jgi:cell division protein FtsW|nr:putative lipid II flippase FtsW [Puniceicoccales bacterium]